jgi:hypothetical protein
LNEEFPMMSPVFSQAILPHVSQAAVQSEMIKYELDMSSAISTVVPLFGQG